MAQMDTRLIEYFLALAEARSFTRAAEELGMSQPALSRLVRRLEDIAGTRLVDRRGRQLALTRAGEALLAEAPLILDQVNLALTRTLAAAEQVDRVLRVGYSTVDVPLHRGIAKFRDRHPDVSLRFVAGKTAAEQADLLRCGELEIGLFHFFNCDLGGLGWSRISRLRFVLAIPEDWPFPSDRPIDLAELSDRPFVLSDPAISPEIHDAQLAYCQSAGFHPKVVRFGRERAQLTMLVASGFGACFLLEPALRLRADGVRYLVIEKPQADIYTDFYAAWLARAPSQLVTDFLDCLISEARDPSITLKDGHYDIEWVALDEDGRPAS